MTVDGNPTPVTIHGNKAQLSLNNPGLGNTRLSLLIQLAAFRRRCRHVTMRCYSERNLSPLETTGTA